MESVTISQLEDLVRASLAGLGHDAEATDILTKWLIFAQLRGNNQGVVKLVGDSLAKHSAERPWSVQYETPSSARIDGGKTNATVRSPRPLCCATPCAASATVTTPTHLVLVHRRSTCW